ncbi:low temperature requirement protein A [Leucobacter sp. gxy201]|uniref:low temperature requirement protein A n=1 Tax=Leucobacter sp. gxy201 TaxID=2957200 RepID=UPI003DA11F30
MSDADRTAPGMPGTHRRLGVRKMRPRDPTEIFRASSPLELFFDLIFAVSVSLASAQLFQAESSAHVGTGIVSYLMVFFAVWWAWMNFTWFASAFDADDWLYRVLALTQMAGVIVLAVGTTPAMVDGDFRIIIAGYVVMRLALVAQWIRASRSHPRLRRTALRFAGGIVAVQVLWVCYPLVPAQWALPVFCTLVLAEVSVPIFAESAGQTPWHPEHIADRYGSFTLIVLGESVLASTTAAANVFEQASHLADFALIGGSGFVLAAGMWWLYFSSDASSALQSRRSPMIFGYGHYAVFAAAGAFSTGIKVLLDHESGRAEITGAAATAMLTVPVAVFVLGVWGLILRRCLPGAYGALIPVGGLLICLCALLPLAGFSPSIAVLAAAAVMAGLVVIVEASGVRDPE